MRKQDRKKVLVVGSFVMDLIVSTSIFPGSGETVLGDTFHMAPGGKGANQAVQMARLGMDVTMVGAVGRDIFGEALLSSATKAGIDVSHVLKKDDVASAIGNIILETKPDQQTQNRIIVVSGANMAWSTPDVEFLDDVMDEYAMVLLQQEIPAEINLKTSEIARRHQVPVMLNPAPARPIAPELLKNITYISPNEHEAKALAASISDPFSESVLNDRNLERLAEVVRAAGVPNMIITLGEHGAMFIDSEQSIESPSIFVDNVVDPTAAGDSFIGAYCSGLVRGLSQNHALLMANYTASLTVSKMGAQSSLPNLTELIGYMEAKQADPELISLLKGWN